MAFKFGFDFLHQNNSAIGLGIFFIELLYCKMGKI